MKLAAIELTAQQTELKAVIDAYNALTADQKALIVNTEKLSSVKAQYAYNAIEAIPSNIDFSSAAAINEARTAYDALTQQEKALVTNYEKLENAEAALEGLGVETLESYNSGDFTTGWDITGATGTATGLTQAISKDAPITMISDFAMESVSTVSITANTADKGSTTFTVYTSIDGGDTWTLFGSGTTSTNNSNCTFTITGTKVSTTAFIKVVVTSGKPASNAKSVSITNITIA